MKNLIRMDLYRAYKTFSTRFLIISYILLIGIIYFITLAVSKTQGIGYDGWLNIDDMINMISRNITPIFFIFFIVQFLHQEEKNNIFKNTINKIGQRSFYIASKLSTIAIFLFVLCVSNVLFNFMFGYMTFFKYNIAHSSFVTTLLDNLICYILILSIGSVIIMIMTITKNAIITLGISIILFTKLSDVIYGVFNNSINSMLKLESEFILTNYIPSKILSNCFPKSSVHALMHGYIVGIIFILVSSIITILIFKKREI